jgi:hypothetical protein
MADLFDAVVDLYGKLPLKNTRATLKACGLAPATWRCWPRSAVLANQIGKFFAGQSAEQAVTGTAEHIKEILGSAYARSDLCASQRRRRRAGAERDAALEKLQAAEAVEPQA